MSATRITVSATINAPLEKVWERYTAPDHITKWNFASADWQCPWAKNDLKVGGKYAARMEAKDGSFGFEFEAIYDVVKVNEELSYTMADGRKATNLFKANGAQTSLKRPSTLSQKTPPKCRKADGRRFSTISKNTPRQTNGNEKNQGYGEKENRSTEVKNGGTRPTVRRCQGAQHHTLSDVQRQPRRSGEVLCQDLQKFEDTERKPDAGRFHSEWTTIFLV